jgi:class 3 adenylate cyclase
MTLRRRWTFSILAILALFGCNLAAYFWGNAQRTRIILDLKVALERKDLAVEIRSTIEDRQRDAEVMEPLIASGAVRLGDEEMSEVESRMEAIDVLIRQLHALSESVETVRLRLDFERLRDAWMEVYRAPSAVAARVGAGAAAPPVGEEISEETESERLEESPPLPQRVTGFQDHYRDVSTLLDDLEQREELRVEEAERRFSAVAAMTDRITLAIFALSTFVAVGIAVWFSRFLRDTFSRYLTAEIVTNVLETPAGLALGGEKREITVLMADLRGFSALAERLPAEQVVAVINNFLGVMTDVIVEAGGTIDEFIGDAILVFFGAPTVREYHAEAAVTCALQMQLRMAEVNEKNRAEGLPQVQMGIGIHSGDVVVGNIGSQKRTKYGAVGSSVNLVGRIEARTVGGQILISQATRERVRAELRIDGQLEIRPKGIGGTIVLFDVGGIGNGDGLQLPGNEESMKTLAQPLAVRFLILEGKFAKASHFDGQLEQLSPTGARLRSQAGLEAQTDIQIGFDAAGARGGGCSIYAKVVETDSSDRSCFLVRFTSLSPEAESQIERLLT